MRMATDLQLQGLAPEAPGRAPGIASAERHYSPDEIAELWNLSPDWVRNTFKHEPGVLVIGNAQPRRGKRSYRTLRIPQSVLERVHKRMS